jgi:hypothetical protein
MSRMRHSAQMHSPPSRRRSVTGIPAVTMAPLRHDASRYGCNQSAYGTSNRIGNGALLPPFACQHLCIAALRRVGKPLLYRCNRPLLAPGTPQSPGQLNAPGRTGDDPYRAGGRAVRLLRGEGRPLHNKTRRRFSSAGLLSHDGDQAA